MIKLAYINKFGYRCNDKKMQSSLYAHIWCYKNSTITNMCFKIFFNEALDISSCVPSTCIARTIGYSILNGDGEKSFKWIIYFSITINPTWLLKSTLKLQCFEESSLIIRAVFEHEHYRVRRPHSLNSGHYRDDITRMIILSMYRSGHMYSALDNQQLKPITTTPNWVSICTNSNR